MTPSITLPRFARDIRQSRPGRAEVGTGAVHPWSGIHRRFGGVLNPGLVSGDWPPAVLSHLALGGLLADALGAARPKAGAEASATPAPVSGEESAAAHPEETAEPTVIEVIRAASEPAASPGRTRAAATAARAPTNVRMTAREPLVSVRDEPPGTRDVSGYHADAADEATDPGRASQPDERDDRGPVEGAIGDEPTAGDERSTSADPDAVSAPRTVVRRLAGGPAAPTVLGDRPTGATSGPPTPAVAGADTDRETGRDSTWADGPTRTASATGSVPAPRAASTPPAMTVLEGMAAAAGDDEPRSETGRTSPAPEAAAGGLAQQDDAPVPGAAPSPVADAPGSTDREGAALLDAVEGGDTTIVHRVIADALDQPRVVDRLFHELERRRRIERERGGRR